jgi:hypothetical protein
MLISALIIQIIQDSSYSTGKNVYGHPSIPFEKGKLQQEKGKNQCVAVKVTCRQSCFQGMASLILRLIKPMKKGLISQFISNNTTFYRKTSYWRP